MHRVCIYILTRSLRVSFWKRREARKWRWPENWRMNVLLSLSFHLYLRETTTMMTSRKNSNKFYIHRMYFMLLSRRRATLPGGICISSVAQQSTLSAQLQLFLLPSLAHKRMVERAFFHASSIVFNIGESRTMWFLERFKSHLELIVKSFRELNGTLLLALFFLSRLMRRLVCLHVNENSNNYKEKILSCVDVNLLMCVHCRLHDSDVSQKESVHSNWFHFHFPPNVCKSSWTLDDLMHLPLL